MAAYGGAGGYMYDSGQSSGSDDDSGSARSPGRGPASSGSQGSGSARSPGRGPASSGSQGSGSWRGGYMFDDSQSSSDDSGGNALALASPGRGGRRGRGSPPPPQWQRNLPGTVWPPLPADYFDGVADQFYGTFGVRPRPPPLFIPAPLIQPPVRNADGGLDPFLAEDHSPHLGSGSDEEEDEAIYDVRQSPRVVPNHAFNLNRDVFLAEAGEEVPHFQSWEEREQWIREAKLLMYLREREEEQQAIDHRRPNIEAGLPPLSEEEQRRKRMDELLLAFEMAAESSNETGLSDPRRPRSPNRRPDSDYEDTASSVYRRHTFEPATAPVRPAEFPFSGRELANEEPYKYPYYCVLVGEINPDFESQRGDVIIIHPGHMGRGRQFPETGFIHTVRGPQDFQQFGVMHGDLNLRIGQFVSVVAEFQARPGARLAYDPLKALLLHSYVDLTTRSRVDPNRHPSVLARYLGETYIAHNVTVDTVRSESRVRELRPGTDVTSHFMARLGDILILPGAWQDNFNHRQNFRRTLVRWYEPGRRADKYLVPGVMLVRPCVDMEFRSGGYLNRELMQATHRTDPNFRWGYVELYSLGQGRTRLGTQPDSW
ncbi:hypothetical protein AXG93_412s1280 [Marchantia polymorpha subsp. ruderalis]|uniref:Uncharacterized protein n=1 Tax=Marchantia polymorpha subsp. ruderalis TaxID=1480154 RepID=A0A176VMR5_MARPO|nr:hypothetical protein AXG93_412s1280 [Marchantia polymorpha subsp. ruderalis]